MTLSNSAQHGGELWYIYSFVPKELNVECDTLYYGNDDLLKYKNKLILNTKGLMGIMTMSVWLLRLSTEGQTTIYKTFYRKLKIEQREAH